MSLNTFSINPKTKVDISNIKNIMINLANDISSCVNEFINIIYDTEYLIMINKIFYIVNNYLKINNFFANGINEINIEIYNQNIDIVVYMYFNITLYHFIYNSSDWMHFYYNLISNPKIVYNQLSIDEKKNLRYDIVSGKFYMIDGINFNYNNKYYEGLILKPYNNICLCKSTKYVYITTLYWNTI